MGSARGRGFAQLAPIARPSSTATEHEAWFREDTEVIDFFAPPRDDFLVGDKPAYISEGWFACSVLTRGVGKVAQSAADRVAASPMSLIRRRSYSIAAADTARTPLFSFKRECQ
jgi:hypothetical protein